MLRPWGRRRQAGGDAVEQAVKAELEPLVPGLGRVRVDALVEHRDHSREVAGRADALDELLDHRLLLRLGHVPEQFGHIPLAIGLLLFPQDRAEHISAHRHQDR